MRTPIVKKIMQKPNFKKKKLKKALYSMRGKNVFLF